MNAIDRLAYPFYSPITGVTAHGMTIREYAAIHLMVPESGDPDLDGMIKKAIAAKTNKAGAFSDPNKEKK